MELVWSDAGLSQTVYEAVCAFAGKSPWRWTDEARGDFKAGPDLYRVVWVNGRWLVYRLVDAGGA